MSRSESDPPAASAEDLRRLPPPGEEGVALFTVSTGWCGGHGDAVLDEDQCVRTLDGLPIFLDDDAWQMIVEKIDLTGTWLGSPVIHVSGRVRLERRTRRNASIPGAPKEQYLALVLTSLEAARIAGERG